MGELTDIWHGVGNGHPHVAFRYTEVPRLGDPIDPAKARLLDGTVPAGNTPMICGGCGQQLWIGDLTW